MLLQEDVRNNMYMPANCRNYGRNKFATANKTRPVPYALKGKVQRMLAEIVENMRYKIVGVARDRRIKPVRQLTM